MEKNNLHHAYALEGEKTTILPTLLKFLEKDFGVVIKNNPDFSYQEFETFTIDDGRALQDMHFRRAIGSKKIFIISTRFVTVEAQNALLKMFEEPTENTHFFIIMPNTEILLPTLRSRLVIKKDYGQIDKDNSNNESAAIAKKFINSNQASRLLLVKNIIEEKDKGKAIDFVTALEQELAPKLTSNPKLASALAEILMTKHYLHDRAPSVKLLLEHLCFVINSNQVSP